MKPALLVLALCLTAACVSFAATSATPATAAPPAATEVASAPAPALAAPSASATADGFSAWLLGSGGPVPMAGSNCPDQCIQCARNGLGCCVNVPPLPRECYCC
jgi:hypothetical protein